MDIEKCCAFTGHRNLEANFSLDALKQAIEGVIEEGVDTFLNGMARGFDLLAAKCVIELKEKYPQLKLIACVPCPKQEKYFPKAEKELYYEVLKHCDEVKLISEGYFPGCMFVRNRYMVDNSDRLIAYYANKEGGTEYTIGYAMENLKEVYVI